MFHPNMSAITEGFAVTADVKCRAWQGVLADVWEVEGRRGAAGEYVSEHPRLFVVLEQSAAGSITVDSAPRRDWIGQDRTPRLSFIPAGLRTWSHVPNSTRLRHLDLHFDIAGLTARFAGELDQQRLAAPRLMFEDDRLLSLAKLLAADCISPRLHDLYGDSIALALFVELFQIPPAAKRKYGQLSPRRLRCATDFIEAQCLRNIKLQDLADLVGLSQSYFSSAFKASTGMAPRQWQTRAHRAGQDPAAGTRGHLDPGRHWCRLCRSGAYDESVQAICRHDACGMGSSPCATRCKERKIVQATRRIDNPAPET